MASNKYYTVWEGREPGVYDNWDDAKEQVEGYPGAVYKAYPTLEDANNAFRREGPEYKSGQDGMAIFRQMRGHVKAEVVNYEAFPEIRLDALAVDAACSKNPGPVEYRGVWVANGQPLFSMGPLEGGTNNIGEYLGLIHALAQLQRMGLHNVPIYTDSRTALSWLRARRSKTTLQATGANAAVLQLLARADAWIATHSYSNPILKWETEKWGEIPADYGRK